MSLRLLNSLPKKALPGVFLCTAAAGQSQQFDKNGIDMIQQKPESVISAARGLVQQEKMI
jgi:hypothetical protein